MASSRGQERRRRSNLSSPRSTAAWGQPEPSKIFIGTHEQVAHVLGNREAISLVGFKPSQLSRLVVFARINLYSNLLQGKQDCLNRIHTHSGARCRSIRPTDFISTGPTAVIFRGQE